MKKRSIDDEDKQWRRDVEEARALARNMVTDGLVTEPDFVLTLLFIGVRNLKYIDILAREIAEEIYPLGTDGGEACRQLIQRAKKGGIL